MTKPEPDFGQDELLQAVATALSPTIDENTDALTTTELVELTGQPDKKIRIGLRRLLAEGRLEETRIHRRVLGGAIRPIIAYRLKP